MVVDRAHAQQALAITERGRRGEEKIKTPGKPKGGLAETKTEGRSAETGDGGAGGDNDTQLGMDRGRGGDRHQAGHI